jgi:hypothetical protein
LVFVGVAEEKVDNSAGALAALYCRVRRRGLVRCKKNAVNAAADVGQPFFAHTAQTSSVDELVGRESAVTNRICVGVCTAVEATIGTSTFVWIDIETRGGAVSGSALKRSTLSKTATATLTDAEVNQCPLINANHATVAIALTVPAAATTNAGANILVGMGGAAAVTVICAAGFGGGGGSKDTVTLAQGDMCLVASDGTNWYVTNVTTAA